MRWILASPIDPARQSLLVEFVETYVALAEDERVEFHQIVRSDPEYTEVQQMITTYKQEGKQEGKQEDLILVLEKKYGQLSDAQRQKIRQIESTAELESLLLAALDATSLEDLPL